MFSSRGESPALSSSPPSDPVGLLLGDVKVRLRGEPVGILGLIGLINGPQSAFSTELLSDLVRTEPPLTVAL
jgi:hypothetical protein